MAIYRCEHSKIGRATHREGAAGDAVRYVTRESAASAVIGTVADRGPGWWDRHEFSLRSNARVCDRFIVSLPREVDARERASVVRDFVAKLTGDRAESLPWVAGIHDRADDRDNPHAHVIISDHDFASGKRVWGASELRSTERARAAWETAVNRGLERSRSRERVSRLSNAARGIDRVPQRKVGPHRGARSREAIAQNEIIARHNADLAELERITAAERDLEARDVARDSNRSGIIKGADSVPPAPPAPLTTPQVIHERATTPAARSLETAPSHDEPGAPPQTPEPGSARQRVETTAFGLMREFQALLVADQRTDDPAARNEFARFGAVAQRAPDLIHRPIDENFRPKLTSLARDVARSISERIAAFARLAAHINTALEREIDRRINTPTITHAHELDAQRDPDRTKGERKPPGGHSGGR